MSKMKELVIDIQEMLDNGYDAEDISYVLGCSIEDVKAVAGYQPEESNFIDINKTGGKW
jgi:hypothetical protein